ncbi:PHB depolymerase family esterase [Riemerella anatipestifer]|uniref:alpha/beta hydrolase family esterase n=1 Tax=Riemerella anatipestifer TaxID=34085 RepID=UPI00129DBC37|nr:plasmid partitioning protein [Riemerella anatipestifer]MRM82943.1 plasmid partitioning protein [Riemerella anatipestifer]
MRKQILLFLGVPTLALAQLTAGVQTYSVSGRSYDVTTPSDYNPTKEYPIVFELHSFDKDRTQMNDPNVINEQQYISVRPEGTSVLGVRAWNSWGTTKSFFGDDVNYITAVYNDIKTKLGSKFNADKVYVYGFSNGGAMVEETSLFKAAVIRSMSFESGHNISSTASKVPMIFIHGTADETVPYQGGSGKYGIIAPNFESIKTTVDKWASHLGLSQPVEIKYLKGSSATSDKDFYFREYSNATNPIYFFVIDDGVHATDQQFSNSNIKRAMIKLAQNPKCYGIYRLACQ